MTTELRTKLTHRDQRLDILRGLAILLVLFRHRDIIGPLTKIGWVGVDLFFVLSGYLVSGLLFKEYKNKNKIDGTKFLLRRGFKIWPSFYFLILITFLLRDIFPWDGWNAFLAEIFFLQNYLPHLWGPTWSLAVEEHFYIFLIIIISATLYRIKNLIGFDKVLLTILTIVLLTRIINVYFNPEITWNHHLNPSHLRIDSLCFGVLISYYYNFNYQSLKNYYEKYKNLLFAIFATFIIPFFFLSYKSVFVVTIGFTILYIAFGILLILTIFGYFDRKQLQNKLLKHFSAWLAIAGVASYNIYLWHIPVNTWIIKKLETEYISNEVVVFAIYFLISILTGLLITHTLESYFLRLREKFKLTRIHDK